MDHNSIFARFWQDYTAQNPSALRINQLFSAQDEVVIHDHIALRTFNDPRVNMDVIMKLFVQNGYEPRGTYEFKQKKLQGRHYEHVSDPDAPKVFVSELELEKCSEFVRNKVMECLNRLPAEAYEDPMLAHSGSLWGQISFAEYNSLRQESEYAAWTLVYGYRANHFAIRVNSLENFRTLEQVNEFVKSNGYEMNRASGSEIYGAPEELLEQSATLAETVAVAFTDGVFEIPCCFYEFTLRYPDKNGVLYPGFIAANADKIFESTNYREKK